MQNLQPLETEPSLETWVNYCKSIGSSNFLLGKVSGFKAWLVWAIKTDVIEKITQGAYGVLEKFVRAVKKVIHDRQKLVEEISSSGEVKEIKILRQKILERVGADAYVSWVRSLDITLNRDEICIHHPFRFVPQKVMLILEQVHLKEIICPG